LNELHKKILSLSRVIRKDLFDSGWINEYSNDIFNRWGVSNLDCLVLSSLERDISFSSIGDQNFIIFDNYILELFDVLYKFYNRKIFPKKEILRFIYKLLSEKHFTRGEYLASSHYITLFSKICIPQVDENLYCKERLYCQQSFIFFHEFMHYLISIKKWKITYYPPISNVLNGLGENIPKSWSPALENKFTNNKQLLEELDCDVLGMRAAIELAKITFDTDPFISSKYILLAHNFMFIISIIDNIATLSKPKLIELDFNFIYRNVYIGIFLDSILVSLYEKNHNLLDDEKIKINNFTQNMISLIGSDIDVSVPTGYEAMNVTITKELKESLKDLLLHSQV